MNSSELIKPRMTTEPLRGTEPKAISVTYGLETGPVGAWMNAYKSSEEAAKREAGFVSGELVEVSKGSGVEVAVSVGVEVEAACKTSCDFRV